MLSSPISRAETWRTFFPPVDMLAAERCFDGAIGGGFVDDLDFFSAASNVSDAGPGRCAI